MKILGISAYYHDSAAAIVIDGEVIAAAQEERFTRKKHDPCFPVNAIEYCLSSAQITLNEVDYVAFYDKPLLKFERLLETYVALAPKGFNSFRKSIPIWIKEKIFQKRLITDKLRLICPEFKRGKKLLFCEHHQSHASSAYYASPFSEAVVLTMDGVGEWATTSVSIGRDNDLKIVKEIHFPHSIGLLYSAFTYYTGFKVNSGEYKVMGLAPYGKPIYVDTIYQHLIDIKEDGSFRLDLSYFDYCTGLTMTNKKFDAIFGGPPRKSEEPLLQRHMDLAASIQVVIEEIILKLTSALSSETGIKNLCLAGGVALNCVANGKVLRSKSFENIWIQPAAGDAGGALGAAMNAYHYYLNYPRTIRAKEDFMRGSYLGPAFESNEIESRLQALGAKFIKLTDDELYDQVAKDLDNQKAVGWFQGKMEFGPRALGNRSILADPRSPSMQSLLNLKVKYRESFRPFAPAILKEYVSDWFDLNEESPYMLLVADVLLKHHKEILEEDKNLFGIEKLKLPRTIIPAITHVDYSARIQTVDIKTNERFHRLLTAFYEQTACPILVNTSFNVRGEPIVCTPDDAFRCFMGTEIESLVVGNYYLEKLKQDPNKQKDYKSAFSLD